MQQTCYPQNLDPTNQQNFEGAMINDSTVTHYFQFNIGTLLMIVLGINHVIFNTCPQLLVQQYIIIVTAIRNNCYSNT